MLKAKSEASASLKYFVNLVENQYATTIKTIRTNNGSEFTMKEFYATKGIIH